MLSFFFGKSDQPLMHRIFNPIKKCDRASAHLVNAISIIASDFSLKLIRPYSSIYFNVFYF